MTVRSRARIEDADRLNFDSRVNTLDMVCLPSSELGILYFYLPKINLNIDLRIIVEEGIINYDFVSILEGNS